MNLDRALIQLLRKSSKVAVLTGAGISKESGIPTFREAQTGLWKNYQATELATPQAFQRNPKLVLEWYMWRRSLVTSAKPNPGHIALVKIAQKVPNFSLITQNVDGLHQHAGSKNPIELHGNILRTKCFEHGHPADHWEEDGHVPPCCPICNGMLRPDVVWFGENLPTLAIERALSAAQDAEVFFSIGTSALVEPAASLPHFAQRAGAVLVEVNPDPTPLTPYADYVLSGPAGTILPELVRQVWPSKGAAS
jgi:NAD-dependent deacetylase